MQRKKKDTPIIAWLADKFQVFRDKEQNFINKQRQLIMIGYAITIMLGLKDLQTTLSLPPFLKSVKKRNFAEL